MAKTTHPAATPKDTARRPLPFASPHFGPRGPVDPEIAARQKAFDAEFGNQHNERVPVVNPDPIWNLSDILGPERAQAIEKSGELSFHAVGDTGFNEYPFEKSTGDTRFNVANPKDRQAEQDVATAMSADVDSDQLHIGPAFLFHLGDVDYFDNTRKGYREQFYEPFTTYPNKIIAIPGNHDCEVKLSQQNFALEAFLENFCPPRPMVPPAGAGTFPPREMVAQPGVFWWLKAPFLDVIGLCSNVGENGGSLRGDNEGPEMYNWFKTALARVKKEQTADGLARKGLIVAMHHPPYTKGGNHSPSKTMSDDLDSAFKDAKLWPDMVLSAHDHDYQRFTRFVDTDEGAVQIPYLVIGGGGRAQSQKHKKDISDGPLPDVHMRAFGGGNGYAIVSASKRTLSVEYKPVPESEANSPDNVTVDLRLRQVQD